MHQVSPYPLWVGHAGDGRDYARLLDLAVGAVEALVRRRVPVLVCCGAGMSRAPAVAAVALGRMAGEPAEAVLLRVLEGRPADISPGLWNHLNRLR